MIEILIAGAISLGTSLMGYAIGSKKNSAETNKIDAETEKTTIETERLKIETGIEKLELIDKLMLKIDSMQEQIDEMQTTINKLEITQCKGVLCPINIEYTKILDKRKARKKSSKSKGNT